MTDESRTLNGTLIISVVGYDT